MSDGSEPVLDPLDAARRAEESAAWDDALRLYDEALERLAGDGEASARAVVLRRVGILHRERGNVLLARDLLRRAIADAEAAGDQRTAAAALNDLGGVQLRAGETAAAEATYLRVRAAAEALGDGRLAAVTEQNLGLLAYIRGDTAAALARYRAALPGLRDAGDDRASALTLVNLALAHVDRREWAEAEAAFDEAHALSSAGADRRTVATVELHRAEFHLKRGETEHARACTARAFDLVERMGGWRLSAVHRYHGVLDRAAGDLAGSEAHLRTAVEVAAAAGDALHEAEASVELALTLLERRASAEALRGLNRAHRLFAALGALGRTAELERRLDALEATYLRVVEEWGERVESADHYTAGHCHRVAEYAARLAAAVGFGGRDLAWIRMGAFLHDVGKTAVPASLLNKPGPLDEEEWEAMRAHATEGARIVAELDFPWEVEPMVRGHHEHWDGSGYPDGLAGERIPLTARILGVADCYDALTTERSYRRALTREQALATMEAQAGRVLDPSLVAAFRDLST
ncbi:MAG TPA: HD-GYP domain-containing protein [Longimicrobium sp.]|nr:HD-GYP domain-containing protein [Longimicrobium sp.]